MRNPKLEFRQAFRWEGSIEDFVRDKASGWTLNMPCGESVIGDVRVDIEQKPNVTHLFDIGNKVPFPCETFDTVISDPPWNIPHFERMKWFFECVYMCKVGGMIIYNATWIPESKAVLLDETWIRQSARFGNVSIISIFKKITNEYDKRRNR
jgi:hypothetical protein